MVAVLRRKWQETEKEESQRLKAEVMALASELKKKKGKDEAIRLRILDGLQKLIARNVHSVLNRWDRRRDDAIDEDDLIQEARMEVWRKIPDYDPGRAAPSTYFGPWIRAKTAYVLIMSGLIHIPEKGQKRLQEMAGSENKTCLRWLAGEPISHEDEEEIKEAMGWNDRTFKNTRDLIGDFSVLSIHEGPPGFVDSLLKKKLEPTTGKEIDQKFFRKTIEETVWRLPDRTDNQKMSFLKRGLEQEGLREAGEQIGISKESVRTGFNTILEDLKTRRRHCFRQFG